MLLAYDNGHSRGADEGPPGQFLSRIANARTILDDVLRQDPGNVDALYVTFENIREDEGASDAAIAYLARALAIDPNNPHGERRSRRRWPGSDRTAVDPAQINSRVRHRRTPAAPAR